MRRSPALLTSGLLLCLTLSACQFQSAAPLSKLEASPALPAPQTSYLELGRRMLQIGDYEQAKDAFIRSLRTEGRTAEALSGVGVAAEKQGLLREAQRYFELAVAAVPDSVVAHNNLGAVLYKLGEFNAAKQAFQAAFALSSGTSDIANRNLGIAEMAIRRERNETVPLAANPRALQRLGSGEYKIREEKTSKSEG